MAGQAGCLQGQGRSAVTHPSNSRARRWSNLWHTNLGSGRAAKLLREIGNVYESVL
ncbi:hypothetical protein J6590_106915 [Homalodisca vitripennis]|nr:hypothetical protein J6590_106915 [Homalodisca vitripennis]